MYIGTKSGYSSKDLANYIYIYSGYSSNFYVVPGQSVACTEYTSNAIQLNKAQGGTRGGANLKLRVDF